MESPDWITPVVCLAVVGGTFLRLLAIDREVMLWRAQAEAEEAAKAEQDRQSMEDVAMTQERDVELA